MHSIATLGFLGAPHLDGMYTLSPYVWESDGGYAMLVRLVNRSKNPHEKVSRIHAATSRDGIAFTLADEPTLAPGSTPTDPDADGCEDPTVVAVSGEHVVYYSGWNERSQSGALLWATVPALAASTKRGIALASTSAYGNPKEATVARCADGTWALFFEYARDGASRIALARGSDATGPWEIDPTFAFPVRPAGWDRYHLSPGPIVRDETSEPLMFFNGGDESGAWRIGWVRFDANYRAVIDRGEEPVLAPPIRAGDESDIAFAASAFERDGRVAIYYTVADKLPKRAIVEIH
ncbi:MAG: hypothetical protein NVS1B2_24170 [Vulcanimicrobiaceae bacterium]